MKTPPTLLLALLALATAHAYTFSFDNVSADRADFTISWTDHLETSGGDYKGMAVEPGWHWHTDRLADPYVWVWVLIDPAWLTPNRIGDYVGFRLDFNGKRPTVESLNSYTIYQPEYTSFVAQGDDWITFHIDNGAPEQTPVPDGPVTWLLAAALGALVVLRRRAAV